MQGEQVLETSAQMKKNQLFKDKQSKSQKKIYLYAFVKFKS